MKKPTPDELVRRVEALETAMETMLGAFKADLAALRADLLNLKDSDHHIPPLRPASGSAFAAQRKASSPSHKISEVSTAPQKKDPRADE